jgi:hypothetical protein
VGKGLLAPLVKVTRHRQKLFAVKCVTRFVPNPREHSIALPVLGQAMYVPEIRCNDQEIVVKVADKEW